MDILANIREFVDGGSNGQGIKPTERYASFDYCVNYFQTFREQDRLTDLVSTKHIQEGCFQLGFYLASWGMLRGSSFLLGKSAKVFEPVVRAISDAPADFWDIDAHLYTPANIDKLLGFKKTLAQALDYGKGPTDTLLTKIMLGVFGNVPAFDSYFRMGFDVSTFGRKALEKIGEFYETNREIIDQNRPATLDFVTGQPTRRLYTRAKVIDMIFFIEGGKKRTASGAAAAGA